MKYLWIYEQFFGIFSVYKKLREYLQYFLKTHDLTVLSYNFDFQSS